MIVTRQTSLIGCFPANLLSNMGVIQWQTQIGQTNGY